MKQFTLKILPDSLLKTFYDQVNPSLETLFENLRDAEISTSSFSFYTSVSSVYSSKIEGENIDLDSYVKYKKFSVEFMPDYTKKTDDLYEAYLYAQRSVLGEETIKNAHALLAKNLLTRSQQRRIRKQNMYVTTPDGRIEYIAPTPGSVESEMKKLYSDIGLLMETTLNVQETFFFASMIHLVFIKIHPFNDGNGRSGRLLEKWFLAQKLGNKAWFVQSEKYYYRQHQTYYNNIRVLGLEYEELDFTKALPFLLMLADSLNQID